MVPWSVMTTLGVRVRELREARHWTEEELSRRAGVPRAWLSMVEQGISDHPTGDSLVRLAQALGVSVDYLTAGVTDATATETTTPGLAGLPLPVVEDVQVVIAAAWRSPQAQRMLHRFAASMRELFLDDAR
jgi:transcriptional regulator with XRE-family HTH domain